MMNSTPCPFFILCAANKEAKKVTEHLQNYKLRCAVDGNTFHSAIGLQVTLSSTKSEITLGRDADVDIFIPESQKSGGRHSDISADQASFYLHPLTGAVLLRDHSSRRNTETVERRYGHTIKIRSSKKSVLVAHGVNDTIAFGRDEWYKFDIMWTVHGLYGFPDPTMGDPYTLGPRGNSKKYVLGAKVGGGAYGTVWSCLDVTTGDLMAVKKFSHLSGKAAVFATREIDNLKKINRDQRIGHDHILEILGTEGGKAGETWGEMFMPLKAGNLKILAEDTPDSGLADIADKVLRQMLLALTCIAEHNIVHRDIKPENILWEHGVNSDYHFTLADFGLSNDSSVARTVAGTESFMAPEIFNKKGKQTKKVDIWSLFATIVWVRDKRFRRECLRRTTSEVHSLLYETAFRPEYSHIGSMGNVDPAQRPSAQTILAVLSGPIDGFTGMIPSSLSSAPLRGDDLPPSFDDRFGAMNLKGDDRDFPDDEDVERRYYEPYTPHLGGLYGRAGESSDASYRSRAPRGGLGQEYMESAHVNPGRPAYRDPGQTFDDDNETAVPDMWTTRAGKMTQVNGSQVGVMDTDSSGFAPWSPGPPDPRWDSEEDRPPRKGKWKWVDG